LLYCAFQKKLFGARKQRERERDRDRETDEGDRNKKE
jgi:hypothetical protein